MKWLRFENRIARIYADSHGESLSGEITLASCEYQKYSEKFPLLSTLQQNQRAKHSRRNVFVFFADDWRSAHAETSNKLANLLCACVKMDNFCATIAFETIRNISLCCAHRTHEQRMQFFACIFMLLLFCEIIS